jgi:large subunit ribosomal protein L30
VAKKLKITRVRSDIGRPERQRATMRALGIRKIRESVVLEDNKSTRGMINAVRHMVEVEEVD